MCMQNDYLNYNSHDFHFVKTYSQWIYYKVTTY